MKTLAALFMILLAVGNARAQIQVDLKFKRLQYVAYEPVIATLKVTNLAGRAIDLQDGNDQRWFGFEVTAAEGRLLVPSNQTYEMPLRMDAGQTVTRKVNLTPLFPIHDLGTYHVRANIYFADLNKFYYSQTKVFQVGDARAIWQKTVGVPEGMEGEGSTRTYSLLANRFPDHTEVYVRVEDKSTGAVYSTYTLGRSIAYDEPQAELDNANQLHVLHCAGPRTWAYSRIGLDGKRLAHSTFMETKSRPRLQHTQNGGIAVKGGMLDVPAAQSAEKASKLSTRPIDPPADD